MKDFLLNIIADPIDKSKLFFDSQYKTLSNEHSTYLIENEVPILLPKVTQEYQTDKIHQDFKTKFDYTEHYQKDAETFDYILGHDVATTDHEFRRIRESITRRIPNSEQFILDVGCGGGWAANYYQDKNNRLVSMDIAKKNVINAYKNYSFENHAAVCADVLNLPFKENSFDYIFSSEVIEHVPDPTLFIKNLLRVLKPGGKLIITCPYDEKLEFHLCVHCNNLTPKHAHLHTFNEINIKEILPKEYKYKFQYQIFGNKYLPKLRTHIILKYFPYTLWKAVDNIANILANKPERFLFEVEK